MMNITLHATEFAAIAHEGQVRDYTGDPYIWHPISVASILSRFTNDPEMKAAALLHDVVEDTDVTIKQIRDKFGDRVAGLVYELTNRGTREAYPDVNRAERRAIDRQQMAEASADAQSVRLADIYHNLSDIGASDPGFARVYMGEKREMLAVLTRGHPGLYTLVEKQINDYFSKN